MLSDVQANPRNLLLELFRQGLAAVNGRTVVHAWLDAHPPAGEFYLVALGKAADAMTAGALDAAAAGLRAGLVVTRYGFLDTPVYRDPRIVSLEAGHPLPDAQSLAAGNALLLFLKGAPADAEFLFLVSGGASSTVEVPVDGVSLEILRQLNAWLLGSGLPISEVNRVRAALSCIKGGRLVRHLEGRRATLLLISDVPGDMAADIGSGLLLPSAVQPLPKLPARFAGLPFQKDAVEAAANVDAHIVASNSVAREGIAAAARTAGMLVHMHDVLPNRDAALCGAAIAEMLLKAPRGLHIWGGETTVILPENPGQGGRCQQLALAVARDIAGHPGILLLAGATDGADGVTDDAGALVDGGSVARGEGEGYDAKDCLARADAGAFLEASGDLIHTGPTGSNVTDIIIAYKP